MLRIVAVTHLVKGLLKACNVSNALINTLAESAMVQAGKMPDLATRIIMVEASEK